MPLSDERGPHWQVRVRTSTVVSDSTRGSLRLLNGGWIQLALETFALAVNQVISTATFKFKLPRSLRAQKGVGPAGRLGISYPFLILPQWAQKPHWASPACRSQAAHSWRVRFSMPYSSAASDLTAAPAEQAPKWGWKAHDSGRFPQLRLESTNMCQCFPRAFGVRE